jgi:hypothetical protein
MISLLAKKNLSFTKLAQQKKMEICYFPPISLTITEDDLCKLLFTVSSVKCPRKKEKASAEQSLSRRQMGTISCLERDKNNDSRLQLTNTELSSIEVQNV